MKLWTVQACGAKYHIEGDFLDETDVDDVVVALVNLARRVSSTYVPSYTIVFVICCFMLCDLSFQGFLCINQMI